MLAKGDVLNAYLTQERHTELTGLLAGLLKDLGVPVIAITNNPNSTLAKFSDVALGYKR